MSVVLRRLTTQRIEQIREERMGVSPWSSLYTSDTHSRPTKEIPARPPRLTIVMILDINANFDSITKALLWNRFL